MAWLSVSSVFLTGLCLNLRSISSSVPCRKAQLCRSSSLLALPAQLLLLLLICTAQDLPVAELPSMSFRACCQMPSCILPGILCFLLPGSLAAAGPGPTPHSVMQFQRVQLSSTARLSHLVLFAVEPVVKPKPTKRGGEKNAGKPRRKKNRGKNKKKGTPCEMEYKNFCIHGECVYLEHLQMVTCK